jgi:hypothetical protein
MKNGLSRHKKDETESTVSLIFPGPEQWELWQGSSAETLAPVETAEQPAQLRKSDGVIFCFPGSAFSSLPLWNPVTEGVTHREQAALNLESRGLLGADPDSAVWAVDVIRRQSSGSGEGERELSAAAVLQSQLPPGWILEGIRRHEIPGRLLPAPGGGSGAVLRRELGRWVLDLYDQGRWLHSQTLLARELGEEAVREIGLLLVQLEQEGICRGLQEIVLKAAVSPEVMEMFPKWAGLRAIRAEGRPQFKITDPAWDLLPKELAERRLAQQRKTRIRTIVTWALVADLAIWVAAALLVVMPGIRLWRLESALAPLRPEYQRILQTKQTWEQLRSLTDPAGSALEVLHQVARPLLGEKPQLAIKLTAFNFGPGQLELQGVTGQGEQVIADYLADLSTQPALQGLYLWPSKAFVEPKMQSFGFTLTAPSTAPQPEKTESSETR